ncbi:MAG: hypothetical protein JJU36_16790 [Phycisphaeraceae bacterium]|nr:hypothetical protein [Phycisphaeraceae bacterium]
MQEAREFKIPLAMLLFAVGLYALSGYMEAGQEGVGHVILALALILAIRLPIGILGCYLCVALLGVSFGRLTTALLKLSATLLFPSAVASFLPFGGFLVVLVGYFFLLSWFFDLDARDAALSGIIIWLAWVVSSLILGVVLLSFLAAT